MIQIKFSTKKHHLIWIGLFFVYQAHAQIVISGRIKDKRTNEDLIGATIAIPKLRIGTVTNVYGYYSLTIPPGSHFIQITASGMQKKIEEIAVHTNLTKYFFMEELDYKKETIEVLATKEDENIQTTNVGRTTLTMAQLKSFPTLLGEIDPVRFLLTTPGVATATDLAQGFNVRGGGIDQNLVLLDDAVLFNPFHFAGIFSAFTGEALKSATLYKTSIPIEYGGRLSSVLDIRQRDGNAKEYSAFVSVSLISATALVEGPLGSEKGSFLIAARRSYLDLLLNLFSGIQAISIAGFNLKNVALYFYDINAKLNYTFDERNRIYASFYMGRDNVDYSLPTNIVNYNYGNIAGTIRWNHVFRNELFSNLILSYTDYVSFSSSSVSVITENSTNKSLNDTTKFRGDFSQRILNMTIKYALEHTLSPQFVLNYGLEGTGYVMMPGKSTQGTTLPKSTETITTIALQNQYAIEWAGYIGVQQKIEKLQLDYGIRLNTYFGLGPTTTKLYQNNQPIIYDGTTGIPSAGKDIGSQTFQAFELSSFYWGIEPRITGRYLLDAETSLKLAYSWLRQNIHMASASSIFVPMNSWYGNDKYLQPEISHNVSGGFYRNFLENTIEISVEGYFRWMQNVIDYVEGTNPYMNPNIEQVLSQADGRAYGLEVYVHKNKGKGNEWYDNITGSVSYTFSRTERKLSEQNLASLPAGTPEYYPLSFDKTHNFSTTISYDYMGWIFSAIFTYQTNIPYNLPVGYFSPYGDAKNNPSFYQTIYSVYGFQKNIYRLRDYHRLDLSIQKKFIFDIPELSRKIELNFALSIFNVYSRINSMGILYNPSIDTKPFLEYGIIPIIPCFSIEVRF